MDSKELEMAGLVIDKLGNLSVTFQHNLAGAGMVLGLGVIVAITAIAFAKVFTREQRQAPVGQPS